MTRQEWINSTAKKEDKNEEFVQKLAQLKAEAEEKTAKKRAKRYTHVRESTVVSDGIAKGCGLLYFNFSYFPIRLVFL